MPNNNELDFEQIYTIFQPKIYRYLTRLIGSKEAEDITQDVFVKVAKALDEFNHESQLSTWIYRIATNTVIDRKRSRSFKQENIEGYALLEADQIEQQLSRHKSPHYLEEQIIRKEMNDCIQECVAIVPENYQACLILSELEGLKNDEIAAILGLSISTVKIRLHRGREKLKQVLDKNCNFYQAECSGRLACEPKGPIIKR